MLRSSAGLRLSEGRLLMGSALRPLLSPIACRSNTTCGRTRDVSRTTPRMVSYCAEILLLPALRRAPAFAAARAIGRREARSLPLRGFLRNSTGARFCLHEQESERL